MHLSSRRPTPLATACLLALAFNAAAQTSSDDATNLDAVRVNAYRTATHASGATKTDTPVLETPQSISVVTREELDARGVKNLNDAVRYNAGVLAEPGGIDNRVDDVRIRGFDVGSWSSNVTLDGMRMPKGGQWTTVQIDNWNMDRVEVLKGPSAVMYGQVAPGGMINQVSKTPDPGQDQLLRVSIDQHGQYQGAFDLGTGKAGDAWLGRLVGLYSDGDTQIKHVSRKHWFLAPSATFNVGDATRLTLLGLYQKDEGGSTFQFLPYQGTMVPTRFGYIKNSTFIGQPDWNVYDREIWTAGWLFEHRFNEHWTLSQGARFSHVDTLFRTTVGGGTQLVDERLLGRRAVQGTGDADGRTVDTHLEGKFDTGALRHDLLIGVDWQDSDWAHLRQAARINANAIAIDVYHPVYKHYDFASVLFPQSDYDAKNSQTGVYLQDQMSAGRWRISVGGRYDRFRNDLDEAVAGTTERDRDSAFTKRAGVLYLTDSGFAPYASYSESFEPVVDGGVKRDGGPLKPTEGKQWEAGLKYQPGSFDGLVTLAGFDLRQTNKVTDDPTNDPLKDEYYVIQTGEYRVRGIELEGRVTPVAGFSVIGAVTRMDSEITRDTTGNQGNDMAQIPDWMGLLWLDYTFQTGAWAGFSVAAGARYVDDLYGDVGNTFHIPSYTLFDAALRYDAGQHGATRVKFALNASNLADKRYVATCGAVTACYYGSGRAVTASATFSW